MIARNPATTNNRFKLKKKKCDDMHLKTNVIGKAMYTNVCLMCASHDYAYTHTHTSAHQQVAFRFVFILVFFEKLLLNFHTVVAILFDKFSIR